MYDGLLCKSSLRTSTILHKSYKYHAKRGHVSDGPVQNERGLPPEYNKVTMLAKNN